MADNVAISAGSGLTIAADEVVDGTLGTVKVQMVKVMDGTLDGTAKMKILAASTAPAAADPAVVVAISPNSVNANGQATMANSAPVVPASNWVGSTAFANWGAGEYETVAASQTDQIMGATGGAGDYLTGVLIVPASTSPGAVSIKDGSGTAITIFAGGATSVSNLVPFFVPLGIIAGTNWKITTGASVSAIGIGNFT